MSGCKRSQNGLPSMARKTKQLLEEEVLELQRQMADQHTVLESAMESEARYHALLNAFEGYIYICSPDLRIEYMNQRFMERHGGDRTGETCYTVIHNRDSQCPWCVNDRVFAGETVYREEKSPIDDRWYAVVNMPLRHADGRLSKYAVIFDINERQQTLENLEKRRERLGKLVGERTRALESAKQALEEELGERRRIERELRDSEEKYRQVVDNATVGIVVTQGGRLQFFNRMIAGTLGLEGDSILNQTFLNFVHPDDREKVMGHHIRRLKGEEDPEPYIMRIVDWNRQVRWVENKGVVINWEGAPATLNFLNEVTEQVAAEKQIRQLSQQLIVAQENERMRISRDLHDSVAQELSTLQIGLQSMIGEEEGLPAAAKTTLQTISGQLAQTITNVRQLSHGLRPLGLDQLGLVRTLRQHCEEFATAHGIQVDFTSAGMENIHLSLDRAINLYRIVQEALGNAARHAHADQVVVRLIAAHPNILCRIQDNGRGFPLPSGPDRATDTGKGMGLRSMDERTRLIGGRFTVRSAPGAGTKIVAEIPIREDADAESEDAVNHR